MGSGGDDSSAQAAQINIEFAREIRDLWQEIYQPTEELQQQAAQTLIPERQALEERQFGAAQRGLDAYEGQIGGLEAQFNQAITEGATDRRGVREAEAAATIGQQFDVAQQSTERQLARRGGVGGSGLSQNQRLVGNLARAGSTASGVNRAREAEIGRLDAAKIAYPAQGLNYYNSLTGRPTTPLAGLAGGGPSLGQAQAGIGAGASLLAQSTPQNRTGQALAGGLAGAGTGFGIGGPVGAGVGGAIGLLGGIL